jgi:hypothetical protein
MVMFDVANMHTRRRHETARPGRQHPVHVSSLPPTHSRFGGTPLMSVHRATSIIASRHGVQVIVSTIFAHV